MGRVSLDKIRIINLFSVVGAFILYAYSFINFYIQDYPAAVFELICGIFLTSNLYFGNVRQRWGWAIDISNVILVLISIHNFNSGGFSQTGPFWVFVTVAIIFLIRGKEGIASVVILYAVLLIFSLLRGLGYINLPYNNTFVITFLISLGTISLLTYLYNKEIEAGVMELDAKNTELEVALKEVSVQKSLAEVEKDQAKNSLMKLELKSLRLESQKRAKSK